MQNQNQRNIVIVDEQQARIYELVNSIFGIKAKVTTLSDDVKLYGRKEKVQQAQKDLAEQKEETLKAIEEKQQLLEEVKQLKVDKERQKNQVSFGASKQPP